MIKDPVIQIKENPRYKGFKGTLDEKTGIIHNEELVATSDERGDIMSNETELLKQQLKNLEQQFDVKLNSRDKLIDAKFENLSLIYKMLLRVN